jgi:hypothetical protein
MGNATRSITLLAAALGLGDHRVEGVNSFAATHMTRKPPSLSSRVTLVSIELRFWRPTSMPNRSPFDEEAGMAVENTY